MNATTRTPRELPSSIDASVRNARPEAVADPRLTAVEREAVDEIFRDSKKLANYAAMGATDEDLSALFFVPVIALAPFESLLKQSRAELALRIRRAHLAAAERGSAESLAYLTAEYLTGRTNKRRRK